MRYYDRTERGESRYLDEILYNLCCGMELIYENANLERMRHTQDLIEKVQGISFISTAYFKQAESSGV
jgi:hypothetical protein